MNNILQKCSSWNQTMVFDNGLSAFVPIHGGIRIQASEFIEMKRPQTIVNGINCQFGRIIHIHNPNCVDINLFFRKSELKGRNARPTEPPLERKYIEYPPDIIQSNFNLRKTSGGNFSRVIIPFLNSQVEDEEASYCYGMDAAYTIGERIFFSSSSSLQEEAAETTYPSTLPSEFLTPLSIAQSTTSHMWSIRLRMALATQSLFARTALNGRVYFWKRIACTKSEWMYIKSCLTKLDFSKTPKAVTTIHPTRKGGVIESLKCSSTKERLFCDTDEKLMNWKQFVGAYRNLQVKKRPATAPKAIGEWKFCVVETYDKVNCLICLDKANKQQEAASSTSSTNKNFRSRKSQKRGIELSFSSTLFELTIRVRYAIISSNSADVIHELLYGGDVEKANHGLLAPNNALQQVAQHQENNNACTTSGSIHQPQVQEQEQEEAPVVANENTAGSTTLPLFPFQLGDEFEAYDAIFEVVEIGTTLVRCTVDESENPLFPSGSSHEFLKDIASRFIQKTYSLMGTDN